MNNPFFPTEDVELIRNGQVVFRGALLLADISGFTGITELLAQSGKHGTEQLTALLNNYFDRMLTIVGEYSGSVITFSGDSLLVRFTEDIKALACAGKMLESMEFFRDITVLDNRFTLRAKVVVGVGEWNQYIIGNSQRSHVLLSGGLIKELARRERDASGGDLIHFHSSAEASSTQLYAASEDNNAFLSPGSRRLYGEHRSVTAIFLNVHTDMYGHEVIENFQRLYLDISATVSRFGGYMHHIDDMFSSGSRIFILFGAPVSQGNDTLNAVLAMRESFSGTQNLHGFTISCGIDTGYAFSGMVGNDKRKQYTVIGDPVNTAARLADNTEIGTITVSESVYNRTFPNLEFTELPGISVKGKNKPLKRFKPLGRLTTIHDSIPFVGRENELAEIIDLINRSNGTILLTGNAGIGKTVLLDRLSAILSKKGFSVVRGARTKHGPASEILITLISHICGITLDMDKAALTEQLHNHLTALGNEQLLMREVYLARMLFGIGFSHRMFDALSPKLRRENLLDAITLLIQELPDPLFVVVEDIHYSSHEEITSLKEVIQAVLRNSGKRVSFLLSSRPDEHSFFKDDTGVSRYHLKGLERDQSFELISGAMGEVPIESEILEALTDRSRGNPFFLVQFLLYLKEKQLIVLRNNCWERTGKSSLESLPESIFSMIMTRIDALAESTRESLKVASVVGVKFSESILRRIIRKNVHPDLMESSRAGLTYALKYSELEYIFSHMLIRDVAYDSMLRERRRWVHGDIGRILEKTNLNTAEDLSRILAYHFENAEEWEKALSYSISAGKLAADEYRNQEAIDHYNTGIRIIEEHLSEHEQDLTECVFQSGQVRERIGEYPEAMECYKRAIDLSTDPSLAGDATMSLADILFTRGNLEEGLKLVDDYSDNIGKEDKPQELRIAAYRAWISCVSGDIDAAMEMALRAVEIGESLTGISELKKARKLGHALNTLATVHWAKSEYSRAKELYERAIEIALCNGMKREAAITYGNIGLVLQKQGKFREAVEGMKKQLKMSTEVGDKLIILGAHGELGMTYAELGNYERALHHGSKQKELAELLNVPHDTLLACNCLAGVHNAMGHREPAMEYAEKALKLSRESSFEREEAQALYTLGLLKEETGEFNSALELFREAEILAEGVQYYSLLQTIWLRMAEILIRTKMLDQSQEALTKAAALSEKTGMQTDMAAYAFTLGELRAARGQMDEAIRSCKEGIEIYKKLDAKPALADRYRSFALLLSKTDKEYSSEAEQNMKKAADLYREMKLPNRVQECVLP